MKEVKQRVLVFFIIGVATLTVRCQPACKAGVNCGDDLGNMIENECCVENHNSRAIRIGFDSNSYHVNEPDGAATLRVQLLGGTISEGRDILVRITTHDISAEAPLDYAAISQVLAFSSSVTFQTMSVSIEDDNLLEIDEMFNASLALENGTDADGVVLQSDLAVITILDEDEVTIGFLPSMYSVVEEDDLAVDLYVQLISGQLGREVTVNLTTQSGSATVGSDFVGVELTFNQEVISSGGVKFQVSIINDDILEEMVESFTAILISLAPRLNLSPGIATVDIIDNDLVTFGFDATEYTVLESTPFTNVIIHQTSGGALDRNVVLLLKTEDGTAISSGEQDFEAHTMELTFGPDVTEQDIMIAIIDDLRLERDNHFIVSLNITDMAITLSPRQTSINIIDNDEVIIGFNQTQYQVDEDVGQAIINVEIRMGILRKPVVVFVFTTNDVAFEGDDYSTVEPRPLTFNRNTSSFLIAINITDDQVHELSENLFGRLSTADGNVILQPQETRILIADNDAVILAPGTASVEIQDNDSVTIGFLNDDVSQLVIAVVVPLSVLHLIVIVGLIVLCLYCHRHSHQSRKGDAEVQGRLGSLDCTVQRSYKLDIPPHLIIHASTIEMKQKVGQGEFGVVYKGHIVVDQGRIITETVAIKTLKGFYDGSTVRDMLKECSKMSKFDHPNILTLRGVCLDGGPAPYIIMPFMANDNLLTYLKDN